MDRINNNPAIPLDCSITASRLDDPRNQNDFYPSPPMTSIPLYQNYGRPFHGPTLEELTNIDRLKDRHIAILKQKNNQLTTDLMMLRQQMAGPYGLLSDWQRQSDQAGRNGDHLQQQIRLLTTTLNEKAEELKQAREEYELIMQERATVHREMREQAKEIERLNSENQTLKDFLKNDKLEAMERKGVSERYGLEFRDLRSQNESLTAESRLLRANNQELTDRNEKICKQLDVLINKYRDLKKAYSKQTHSSTESKSLDGKFNTEILIGHVSVTDVKMLIVKIDIDKIEGYGIDENKLSSSVFTEGVIQLKADDELLEIDGKSVRDWSDDEILDYLSKYQLNDCVQVMVSRCVGVRGMFVMWKEEVTFSSLKSSELTPLWLVSKSVQNSRLRMGDVLHIKCNTSVSKKDEVKLVTIVRMNPIPFAMTENPNTGTTVNKLSEPFDKDLTKSKIVPPILPLKKSERNRPMSVVSVLPLTSPDWKHNHFSSLSVPPIPPRSVNSLQCSFIENTNSLDRAGQNEHFEDMIIHDDTKCDKLCDQQDLNISIKSAFDTTCDIWNPSDSMYGDVMWASFSGSSGLAPLKMPKLGKCRNITLTLPSQISTPKGIGLHLMHTRSDMVAVSSKSDIDISNINQVFVKQIEPNSVAGEAGLVEGDQIISINNQSISHMTVDDVEGLFLSNHLNHQKFPLIIKVQFNPLKMVELSKEKSKILSDLKVRPMSVVCDESRLMTSIINENPVTHRLQIIRSSSDLSLPKQDMPQSPQFDTVRQLQSQSRTIRIKFCTVLNQIKLMGGSAKGLFISNVVYLNSDCEHMDKKSIGNRLAVGDRITRINNDDVSHLIGEEVVNMLNELGSQISLTVMYDPTGLLEINRDPLSQEHFYMESMFSFSELDNSLSMYSEKSKRSSSLSSKLDYLGINIPFVKSFHLSFNKHDILMVDATILPANMHRLQDSSVNHWHAWIVDRHNNKIREGMIPSAFWLEKTIISKKKFSVSKNPYADDKSRISMRSTPTSPTTEVNGYSSNTNASVPLTAVSSSHRRHGSLGTRWLRKLSQRSHPAPNSLSVDDMGRTQSLSCIGFIPTKRIPMSVSVKRPVVLIGAHADTISMALASRWPQEFSLSELADSSCAGSPNHKIINVSTIQDVCKMHQDRIYPIVLLLKYRSVRQIRKFRIGKSSQIKIDKLDCMAFISQIQEYEGNWSHLINGCVTPNNINDSCEEVRKLVQSIQLEDVWLRLDRFQYSE